MATLQRIRNAGPVVIIVLGIALLAFLLGDINKLFSSGNDDSIAEINGESISLREYQARYTNFENGFKTIFGENSVSGQNQKYIKNEVWNKMTTEYMLDETYKNLGIEVSGSELAKIISGNNMENSIDPLTRQIFTDPQTGKFNSQQAVSFFQNAEQTKEGRDIARFLERELIKNRQYAKYAALIQKGINVTDFEAKKKFLERTAVVDFDYAVKKYAEIPDNTIQVSEKDLNNYYKEHKKEYKQKASRDISYVVFKITPSEEDIKQAEKEVMFEKSDFAAVNVDTSQLNMEIWLRNNSQAPFDPKHLSREELNDSLLFNASTNEVFGPFYENEHFVLKRVIDRAVLPDTVEAEHILIQPNKDIPDLARAEEIADSLKSLIENGADFAALAEEYSADKSSASQGGKLDKFTEGTMVTAFNDACFKGKPGDITVVKSPFGVHVIRIISQSTPKVMKVRVAVAKIPVSPGNETISKYYAQARDFSAQSKNNTEKFNELIEKNGYTKRLAREIAPENENIPGIENPSPVINWLYKDETKKEDVSMPFQDGNIFIVANVTEIREKGIATLEQIKEQIENLVIKKKKGEILEKEISTVTDLNKSAQNISFSSFTIKDEGVEPQVIAVATKLPKNEISKPIVGENGVYKIKVTSKTSISPNDDKNIDFSGDKRNAENRLLFKISRGLQEALEQSVGVVDNRHKFF
ncbi:MAG: hypothetical protein CSB06_00945 [Bacteroidia bacterium]|nr:MAG: hypothetical protein CSB06_00945 [Bacteroidia bacterium]